MKTAFLFPGQGAQTVGMGKDLYQKLPAAKAIFDQAQQITGLPLKKLCFEGPEEELSRTDIAQPAIFTVSVAMLAGMNGLLGPDKAQTIRPEFFAGLSLGEYTALFAAGMIDFEDALKLVCKRGAAMQKAATATSSGMVALIGADESKANELCRAAANGDVLTLANFNCPGQIVVSGAIEACKRAEAMAKDFGLSATPLKVAGAFHSEIMAPAAAELDVALDAAKFTPPVTIPAADRVTLAESSDAQSFSSAEAQVLANVDAQPYGCLCRAKELLLRQLTGAVRWQQCMEYLLAQGVERFYEIGPGRSLAGMMKRINRRAEVVNVNSLEALEKLAADTNG
jgi:[acyl-carrier-protein] S-malonyltransferase